MSWFADLAGKAENLLTNIDEQTGAALRNPGLMRTKKYERQSVPHPEPLYTPKRRSPPPPPPRPLRKVNTDALPVRLPANRKSSPASHFANMSITSTQEHHKLPAKGRKPSVKNIHTMENTRNIVDYSDGYPLKRRTTIQMPPSSPDNAIDIMDCEDLRFTIENLEVENAMLKNEMNVLNKEMAALLDKLRVTGAELDQKCTKLKSTQEENLKLNSEKQELDIKLEVAQEKIKSIEELEGKIKELCDKNAELENMLVQVNQANTETTSAYEKLEADLKQANDTIQILQDNLVKSNEECQRLESDWAQYKHRVKNMLTAKDKELAALQQCSFTEDKQSLLQQIELLKEEREILSNSVKRVREEYEDMKQFMDSLVMKHSSAERVVFALRDALREERAARNRAEAQCGALSKELKAIQIETGQTIASLRVALRDKHQELCHAKEAISSSRTTESSALNVADYDVSEANFDREKVYNLTQKLVTKQGKLESLLAENNSLKIQLEKEKKKPTKDIKAHPESVVQVPDRHRNIRNTNAMLQLSRKMGLITRTYPWLSIMVILYMVGLHLWVFAIILKSTSDLVETSRNY